jgi:hypothetical protein
MTSFDGSYGIVFGINADWSEFYTFEISRDRDFYIWRYQEPGWSLIKKGRSDFIDLENAKNIIAVKRDGDLIYILANGNLIASVEDGTYTGIRYVGLIVSVFYSNGYTAEFDDFKVAPTWCEGILTDQIWSNSQIELLAGASSEYPSEASGYIGNKNPSGQ